MPVNSSYLPAVNGLLLLGGNSSRVILGVNQVLGNSAVCFIGEVFSSSFAFNVPGADDVLSFSVTDYGSAILAPVSILNVTGASKLQATEVYEQGTGIT